LLALIRFFFELCLLRRAPQGLPASTALLGVTVVVNLLAGVMLAATVRLSPAMGLAQGSVDMAFMLALLFGALYLLDRLPRFRQSATALLGSGAVLEFIAVVPLGLLPPGEDGEAGGDASLLFLALIVWSILVTGHILRHTFELRLGQGVAIAVLYGFFSYTLLGGVFAGA